MTVTEEGQPLERVRVHVRFMIRRDMPEVMAIERGGFDHPWEEEDFLRCLRERNCIGMVAEHQEKVVGFIVYGMHKARLSVINFAVHPEFRRLGIGGRVVARLVSKLSEHRRTRITVEVRETNLTAQLFFRSMGFKATAVLPAFYEDTGEDAFVMCYRLAAGPSEP